MRSSTEYEVTYRHFYGGNFSRRFQTLEEAQERAQELQEDLWIRGVHLTKICRTELKVNSSRAAPKVANTSGISEADFYCPRDNEFIG